MEDMELLADAIRNTKVEVAHDHAKMLVPFEDLDIDSYFDEYASEIQTALDNQLVIDFNQDTWFYHDGIGYLIEFWVKPNLEEQQILKNESRFLEE